MGMAILLVRMLLFAFFPAALAILSYNALWSTILPLSQAFGVWMGFTSAFYVFNWFRAVRTA